MWAFLAAIFRYLGDARCVRGCFAACPHKEVAYLLSEGLTQVNSQPVTDMLKRGFQLDWSMRSTVSAYSSKGEMRKLVFLSSPYISFPVHERPETVSVEFIGSPAGLVVSKGNDHDRH